MSEKLTNNNIDDIFRNSIDNMETEPSESFWINASEDALFKSNLIKKRSINRWRIVAAVFSIAVMGLTAYIIYMQKQLNDVKSKLVAAEHVTYIQPAPVANSTTVGTSAAPVITKQATSQAEERSAKKVVKQQEVKHEIATNSNTSLKSVQPLVYEKKKHKKHDHINASASTALNSTNVSSTAQPLVYERKRHKKHEHGNTITASAVNSNKVGNNGTVYTSTNEPIASNASTTEVSEGPEFINVNGNNTIPQASALPLAISNNIEPVQSTVSSAARKNILSKLSVSLFFEPYISDELLENEATDIVTVNNVSANEEEAHPFVAGLKVDYNILKNLSITTGCLFYSFNVSVAPTTIYAQKQQNGEVGYSFQTSIGTVNCPYVKSPKVGDGMVVSGEEKASYICIPIQLKYNFITNSKWGLYLTGGIEANIIALRQMDMQWRDFNWDEGNAKEGIDNSKKIYTSYYLAPGVRYNLYKGISIFLEPSLQGSPIFSKGANTLPYAGIGTGITYHF